jgi:hypothetical protein
MKIITLKDMFSDYPYKCQHVTKTIPVPYIKAKDVICDHQYSVTYKEWILILSTYVKYVRQYLFQGNTYKLPHRMGDILIIKTKAGFTNFNTPLKNTDGTWNISKNTHTNGYKAKIYWDRFNSRCTLSYKWLFKLRTTHTFRKELAKYIFSNFNNINKFTTR